ncbi:hypothetical protein KC330_g8359 [Hortaea werneckii]|nr:hypothetical protein KC330_g8359 [Hortaea werneckii]
MLPLLGFLPPALFAVVAQRYGTFYNSARLHIHPSPVGPRLHNLYTDVAASHSLSLPDLLVSSSAIARSVPAVLAAASLLSANRRSKTIIGPPTEQFKADNFTPVPVLIDHHVCEGPYFSSLALEIREELVADLLGLWQTVPQSTVNQVLALFPPWTYNGSLVADMDWFNAMAPGYNASTAYVQRQAMLAASMTYCPSTTTVEAATDNCQPAYKIGFDAETKLHGAIAPFLWSTEIDGDSQR